MNHGGLTEIPQGMGDQDCSEARAIFLGAISSELTWSSYWLAARDDSAPVVFQRDCEVFKER